MKPAHYLPPAALALLAQCHRADPSPADQLPSATQTGANTFGCLLNGSVWVPSGNTGSSNYAISHDENPYGVLNLTTYRYPIPSGKNFQSLKIYLRNLRAARSYDFQNLSETHIGLNDTALGCDLNSGDANTYYKGSLLITRLDKAAGIVAGTFESVLARPGCDTVRVTQGRFDKRL